MGFRVIQRAIGRDSRVVAPVIDALVPGKMHVHDFHEVRRVPGWC